MYTVTEIEHRLEGFDREVQAAWQDARARLRGARRVKLGDLNLRESLYREMVPVFHWVCSRPPLYRVFFSLDPTGRRSRRLLLIFMSELVYWEYERSFWQKLNEVLQLDATQRQYHWFTRQMLQAYEEGGIPLVVTYGWSSRREYVRTIVGESGFSRQLVSQAKSFVIWYFDTHSELDPRTLATEQFDHIVDQSGLAWNKDDIFELLRGMIGDVSRLLREIRHRFLTSSDLLNPQVLAELEETLGFHPVRGIFGFRKEEDIQDLLEKLSKRVRPSSFHALLSRKIHSHRGALTVITPDGQSISAQKPGDVPIVYGEYRVLDPHPVEIQVVPREAVPLSELAQKLQYRMKTFYTDDTYAWLHDDESFEVFQGSTEPEEPRRYFVAGLQGYLWYGKQKIGIPLHAERDGQIFSALGPRHDIWLNPRLRLGRNETELQVVIPSFVCYEPRFAGQTARLELNGRPIEDTTYVIGIDGSLQFQATRVASVQPGDIDLVVSLVTVSKGETITENVTCSSLAQDFLFSVVNRERIRPGVQRYGGNRFVLFHGTSVSIKTGKGIEIERADSFGLFQVYRLSWIPDPRDPKPFDLEVGGLHWTFTQPLEISTTLLCAPVSGPFKPQEPNSAFNAEDVKIYLHVLGQPREVSELWDRLSLIIEKDHAFLTDFSLTELRRMSVLAADSIDSRFVFAVSSILDYLLEQYLTDRQIGTYRWSLMLRPEPTADLEPLSVVEFMLLPTLRVEGTDVPIAEGEETLITVSSSAPLLADMDDKPTNTLQLSCRTEAVFDGRTGFVQAKPIQKTVRLTYPLTKVALEFVPNLFAIRLVCSRQVRSRLRLTRTEASTSYLAVLVPSDRRVWISGPDSKEEIGVDAEGRGRFSLDTLLPTVTEERTSFEVTCCESNQRFEIFWTCSLRFEASHCLIETEADEHGTLVLALVAEGPASTNITFKLSDSKLRSQGQQLLHLGDIDSGEVRLPIDLKKLQGAHVLYCAAFANKIKLDSVQVACGRASVEEAEAQLTGELESITLGIETASPWELLRRLQQLELLIDSQSDITQRILQEMYACRCLDHVYVHRDREDWAPYFPRFQASLLGDTKNIPIAKLKKYCDIRVPKLQVACAEGVIQQGDGAGVEVILDLMADGVISWRSGREILSRHKACASEMICDMVEWDDLEREDDRYIALIVTVSELFHPAMATRAKAARDWKRALELCQSGEIVYAKVANWNPNGLVVPIGLVPGQLPIEELDASRHGLKGSRQSARAQLAGIVDKTLPVRIIDVSRREGRLLLSEKQAIAQIAERLLCELKSGDVRSVTITGVADYGAFVDLGGLAGLIHISELSWEQVSHPRDVVRIGDEVQACIISVDRERRLVSLSRKKLLPDPLLEKIQKYKVGQNVHGRVTRLVEFGVFVRVEDEVDGLVPISELSDKTVYHPRAIVKEGDELLLRVLHADEEKCRLKLSLKQVGKDDLFWGTIRVRITG